MPKASILATILPIYRPSFSRLRKIWLILFALFVLFFSRIWLPYVPFHFLGPLVCPSPFQLPGHLHVDLTHPSGNYWVSKRDWLSSSCTEQPQDLIEDLQAYLNTSSNDAPDSLQFLVNRTVALFGDSIDRNHLDHFCTFLGITPQVIYPYNPLYPAHLRELEEVLVAEDRMGQDFGTDRSRPWLCHAEQLNFTLLWVFYMGSDDGWTTPGVPPYDNTLVPYQNASTSRWGPATFWPPVSEHFSPPLRAEARIDEVVLPLLRNMGRTADLVEIGVGAWDLDMFKRLDNLAVRHYLTIRTDEADQEDSLSDLFIRTPLSEEREEWLARRMDNILQHALVAFPRHVPIYLRPLHITPQYYHWPYLLAENRIRALDDIARRTVSGLEPQSYGWWSAAAKSRVDMDNTSYMIEGQTNEMDHIHPGVLPGSWLWGQWLLHELRQAAVGASAEYADSNDH